MALKASKRTPVKSKKPTVSQVSKSAVKNSTTPTDKVVVAKSSNAKPKSPLPKQKSHVKRKPKTQTEPISDDDSEDVDGVLDELNEQDDELMADDHDDGDEDDQEDDEDDDDDNSDDGEESDSDGDGESDNSEEEATEENDAFINLPNSSDAENSDDDDETMLESLALSDLRSKTIVEARNDEAGLQRKLNDIALFADTGNAQRPALPFRESLCVMLPLERPLGNRLAVDDLARERAIAEATTSAVHAGLDKLRAQRVRFRRPSDYLAQMVKTDAQMARVKKRLVAQKERIENAQTRRNNRDLKKNRKKVRQEQLEKQQAKKQQANEEIQAVKNLRQDRLEKRSQQRGSLADVEDVAEHDASDAGKKHGHVDDDDEFPIDMLDVEQLGDDSTFQKHRDIVSGKKKAWKSPSLPKNAAASKRNRRHGEDKDAAERSGPPHRGGGQRDNRAANRFKPDGSIKKKSSKGKAKRLGKSRRNARKARS